MALSVPHGMAPDNTLKSRMDPKKCQKFAENYCIVVFKPYDAFNYQQS